jgi:hypothetical protein
LQYLVCPALFLIVVKQWSNSFYMFINFTFCRVGYLEYRMLLNHLVVMIWEACHSSFQQPSLGTLMFSFTLLHTLEDLHVYDVYVFVGRPHAELSKQSVFPEYLLITDNLTECTPYFQRSCAQPYGWSAVLCATSISCCSKEHYDGEYWVATESVIACVNDQVLYLYLNMYSYVCRQKIFTMLDF